MSPYVLTAKDCPGLMQRFGLHMLRLLGWTVAFKPVPGPHGVVVVYPHTSNWDFIYGLFAKWAIGIRFRFLGKPALFRWPLGLFMRAVGGEPVVRDNHTGAISRFVERMHAADFFWLAITPEGTRSYKPYWRSGFYHIAVAAKTPLGICKIDYATKQVNFTEYLTLTGEEEKDLEMLRAVFAGTAGKNTKDMGPIVFKPKEKEKESA